MSETISKFINPMHRPVMQKAVLFRSESLRRAVASLPCMLCGLEGSTQASHSNQSKDGRGMSHKSSDACLAALCCKCHFTIDYGKDLSREEKIERWDDAHRKTMRALLERGLLIVDKSKL